MKLNLYNIKKKDMAEYYFKAENVLMSCQTLGQLETSRNYIEMYLNETKDKSGYDILLRKYLKLRDKLVLDYEL